MVNQMSIEQTNEVKPDLKYGNFTPFILLLGMSIHGLFEAIAIGLQKEMTPLVNLTIAVNLHKWAAAFSLVQFFFNYKGSLLHQKQH